MPVSLNGAENVFFSEPDMQIADQSRPAYISTSFTKNVSEYILIQLTVSIPRGSIVLPSQIQLRSLSSKGA